MAPVLQHPFLRLAAVVNNIVKAGGDQGGGVQQGLPTPPDPMPEVQDEGLMGPPQYGGTLGDSGWLRDTVASGVAQAPMAAPEPTTAIAPPANLGDGISPEYAAATMKAYQDAGALASLKAQQGNFDAASIQYSPEMLAAAQKGTDRSWLRRAIGGAAAGAALPVDKYHPFVGGLRGFLTGYSAEADAKDKAGDALAKATAGANMLQQRKKLADDLGAMEVQAGTSKGAAVVEGDRFKSATAWRRQQEKEKAQAAVAAERLRLHNEKIGLTREGWDRSDKRAAESAAAGAAKAEQARLDKTAKEADNDAEAAATLARSTQEKVYSDRVTAANLAENYAQNDYNSAVAALAAAQKAKEQDKSSPDPKAYQDAVAAAKEKLRGAREVRLKLKSPFAAPPPTQRPGSPMEFEDTAPAAGLPTPAVSPAIQAASPGSGTVPAKAAPEVGAVITVGGRPAKVIGVGANGRPQVVFMDQ